MNAISNPVASTCAQTDFTHLHLVLSECGNHPFYKNVKKKRTQQVSICCVGILGTHARIENVQ